MLVVNGRMREVAVFTVATAVLFAMVEPATEQGSVSHSILTPERR